MTGVGERVAAIPVGRNALFDFETGPSVVDFDEGSGLLFAPDLAVAVEA